MQAESTQVRQARTELEGYKKSLAEAEETLREESSCMSFQKAERLSRHIRELRNLVQSEEMHIATLLTSEKSEPATAQIELFS